MSLSNYAIHVGKTKAFAMEAVLTRAARFSSLQRYKESPYFSKRT